MRHWITSFRWLQEDPKVGANGGEEKAFRQTVILRGPGAFAAINP
jgi:hypothetical protein